MRISADCVDQEESGRQETGIDANIGKIKTEMTEKVDVSPRDITTCPVKVIYRIDLPRPKSSLVPLTVIPICDSNYHGVTYFSNYEDVKDQVLNINFDNKSEIPKKFSFVAIVGEEMAQLALNNEEDYSTALKVAELCEQPLHITLKVDHEESTMTDDLQEPKVTDVPVKPVKASRKQSLPVKKDLAATGAIPKRRLSLMKLNNASNPNAECNTSDSSSDARQGKKIHIADEKKTYVNDQDGLSSPDCENFGSSRSSISASLSESEKAMLKKEITSDVTKSIVQKLIACLKELDVKEAETNDLDKQTFAIPKGGLCEKGKYEGMNKKLLAESAVDVFLNLNLENQLKQNVEAHGSSEVNIKEKPASCQQQGDQSENQSKQSETQKIPASTLPVHRNVICDHCDQEISGIRYKCSVCPDFDLCQACEVLNVHEEHPFLKIKKPLKRFIHPPILHGFGTGVCTRNLHRPQRVDRAVGEDIYVALDVDLPSGNVKVGDIKVVPMGSSSVSIPIREEAVSAPPTYNQSQANNNVNGDFTKFKLSDYRVKKLTKKLEKIRNKGQRYSTILANASAQQTPCSNPVEDVRVTKSETKANSNSSKSAAHKSLFLSGACISEETVSEGTKVAPGTKFKKTWKVRNAGTKPWTVNTSLRYVWGDSELVTFGKITEVSAPPLKTGEDGRISISFISPKTPGFYQSHWRLHHRGQPFGQKLICKIIVDPALGEKNSSTRSSLSTSKQTLVRKKDIFQTKKHSVVLEEALTAVKETRFNVNENDGTIELKSNVKSHTATPTNTPFNISPPKSPEPSLSNKEVVYDTSSAVAQEIKCVWPNVKTQIEVDEKQNNQMPTKIEVASAPELPEEEDVTIKKDDSKHLDGDESASIFSLSSEDSAESGDEFVVVPMPRCFDMNIPFSTLPKDFFDISSMKDKEEEEEDESESSKEGGSFEMMDKIGDEVSQTSNDMNNPNSSITSPKMPFAQDDALSPEVISPTEVDSILCDETFQSIAQMIHEQDSNGLSTQSQSESQHKSCEREIISDSTPSAPALDKQNSTSNVEEEIKSIPNPSGSTNTPSTNPFRNDFQPNTSTETDNIIHVLPESIVTGALTAAAHVYNNVSRAFFANKNEESNHSRPYAWITSPPPAAIPLNEPYWQSYPYPRYSNDPRSMRFSAPTNASANEPMDLPRPNITPTTPATPIREVLPTEIMINSARGDALKQLYEMGFWNQKLNADLLEKNKNDVNSTIEDLLSPENVRQRRGDSNVVVEQPGHKGQQINPTSNIEFD